MMQNTVDENVLFRPKSKIRCFTFEKKERLQFALWEKLFFTVVKTAFQQRRKTMRNSLKQ
jgi:16S rRNA (adenine1518-N6/adenine1519-N6)-dimethyltransferase